MYFEDLTDFLRSFWNIGLKFPNLERTFHRFAITKHHNLNYPLSNFSAPPTSKIHILYKVHCSSKFILFNVQHYDILKHFSHKFPVISFPSKSSRRINTWIASSVRTRTGAQLSHPTLGRSNWYAASSLPLDRDLSLILCEHQNCREYRR